MIVASLIAAGLATVGAGGPDPADCPHQAGPATLTALTAKPPDGAREDALGKLCARVEYGPGSDPHVYLSLSTPDGDPELASVYPRGTRIRAVLETGPRPLSALMSARDASARFERRRLTVTGMTTRGRYATRLRRGRPVCSGETFTFESYFDAFVLLRSRGSPLALYQGSSFGTNAQWAVFPSVPPRGFAIELLLDGCGDGRRRTREGYFEGFLPVRTLAQLGLDRGLLLYLPNDILDYLLRLEDNGDPARRARFRRVRRHGVLGVAVDYRLSYSFHKVRTKAIRRALRVARSCRRKGGELDVVRGEIVCRTR